MNRKKKILLLLLPILVLSIGYAFLTTPRQQSVQHTNEFSQTTKNRVEQAEGNEPRLNSRRVSLEQLDANPQPYPGAKRDIFNFKVRRLPAVVVPKVESKPKIVIAPPTAPPPVTAMQRTLSKFTFLGFLEKNSDKTIFLSSDGALYTVKKGEHFGTNSEFFVDEISNDVLTVQRSMTGEFMRVSLVPNEQLKPMISSPANIERRANIPFQPRTGWTTPRRPIGRPGFQDEQQPFDAADEQPMEQFEEGQAPENGDVVEGENDVSNQ